MRGRSVHVILVLAVVAAALSGCGFREDKQFERLFNSVREKLQEAGTARFAIKTTIDSSRAEEPTFRLPPTFRGEGVADFGRPRAAVNVVGEDKPVLIYDDTLVFARRIESVLQNDPRPWGKLDFAERDVGRDVRSALGLNAVNPVLLMEFARGMSIGGLQVVREKVRGVDTTRYTARIAPQVAMIGRSGEQRDALRRAMASAMGIRGTIFPGSVWLDDDRLLRRIRFTVKQAVDRENVFATTYDIEVFDFGASVDIPLPPDGEAVTTKSFGGLAIAVDITKRSGSGGLLG